MRVQIASRDEFRNAISSGSEYDTLEHCIRSFPRIDIFALLLPIMSQSFIVVPVVLSIVSQHFLVIPLHFLVDPISFVLRCSSQSTNSNC